MKPDKLGFLCGSQKIDLVVQRDSLEWGAHEGKSSSMLFAVFLDFGANEI